MIRSARCVVAAVAAIVASAGFAPVDVMPQAEAALLPATVVQSKPVLVRINGVRFRVTAVVVRTFPGTIPDPLIAPPPGPTDSLSLRFEQIGSRRVDPFRSVIARINIDGAASTLTMSPGASSRAEQLFYANPLPPGTLPVGDSLVSPRINLRALIRTNRGVQEVFIPSVPFTTTLSV
jgi:hypothetical protein